MRKFIILFSLLLFVFSLQADVFRFGVLGAVESYSASDEVIDNLFEESQNITPGFYWEVLTRHWGFGMSYLARFEQDLPLYSEYSNEWYLNWDGSFDFRYHVFRHSFFDPFAELSVGSVGGIDLTGSYNEPFYLSLYAEVGYGLALNIDGIHLGGKVNHRIMNDIPPVTNFEAYPLSPIQFTYFIGISI